MLNNPIEKIQSRLEGLLQFSQAIGQNFSEKVLTDMYGYLMQEVVGVEYFFLSYHDAKEWKSFSKKLPRNIHFFDEISWSKDGVQRIEGVEPYQFSLGVRHKDQLVGKLAFGSAKELEGLEYVEGLTTLLVVALFSRSLLQQQINRQMLDRDIQLAADIQSLMIKPVWPESARFQGASFQKAYGALTGDYCDCVRMNEDEWFFCIGDVSGKGIAAALLRANFQAQLHVLLSREFELVSLLTELNRHFYKATQGERFITFFAAIFNSVTGDLKYVNAGNVPPVLQVAGKILELSGGTTMLGAFEKLPFIHLQERRLQEAFRLVLFTDGLSEATDIRGEMILEGSLIEESGAGDFNKLPADFLQDLMLNLKRKTLSEQLEDDLSLVCLQWSGVL